MRSGRRHNCNRLDEVDAILVRNGILVRIKRPGVGPVNDHASETAIDDALCDAEVVNDGTPQELAAKVLEVCGAAETTEGTT